MVQQTFGPEITERAFNENIHHIISDPFNAIIEIITNSWDAGAEEVSITWPSEPGGEVIFEDDGEGMTEVEFREIWPKISYSRLDFKDKEVKFRRKREGYREAYGKHGKGRHSPFSFADSYLVETWKDGKSSRFKMKKDKNTGFKIEFLGIESKEGNGTKISFKVNENFREPLEIKKEMGTRFLTDPSFIIRINGEKIKFDDVDEYLEKIECKIDNEIVKILKMKSGERSKDTRFRGVTWITRNIRIKTTVWDDVLDGRIDEARHYAYVVYSDILKDELNDNLSDFVKSDRTERIQNKVYDCIRESVNKIMASKRDEIKKSIIKDNLISIKEMSSSDQDDVGSFISELQQTRTVIKTIDLKAATETFINIKKSKSGSKFLRQLSKLDPDDIESLSKILDEWSVKEARVVLDLIHSRIELIKELELKTSNPQTLELEELQPLFQKGLWIFGPEYESIEFTSNRSLATVACKLLGKKFEAKESRLRPDFVVLPDSTIGIHSCDKFNDDGESEGIEKILFLELKRGGLKIDLDERMQVEKYINILIEGGAISKETKIDAYVMGSTVVCEKIDVGEKKLIKIIPVQYHSILSKADKRLLNLRKKIEEVKKIKDEPTDNAVRETLAQTTLEDHE